MEPYQQHATSGILQGLRNARERAGLSQREVSARVGLPQGHISRIERGATDLRLSSLVELARALELDVVVVPRRLLPAVEAILQDAWFDLSDRARAQTTALRRARSVLARFAKSHPGAPDLSVLTRTLRELAALPLRSEDIATIRDLADQLGKAPGHAVAEEIILRSSREMSALRDRILHAALERRRPAYALDGDEDDGDG